MHKPVVSCGPVVSKVILIGQAPGVKEPVLQRPFAWTAGKTLFGWFEEATGLNEQSFRESVYMTAVCRCYPGKNPKGGDRVPNQQEIENCKSWLDKDFELLKPDLVIAVGKGKVLENGTQMPLDLKKDDRILFSKYAGTDIKIEGDEYLIMREDDVLGVIEK